MAKLKSVYGTPWSKLIGQNVPITQPLLKKAGDIILQSVLKELKKDLAKSANMGGRGKPVPLPNSKRFVDSFSFSIRGEKTIDIVSNWPHAEQWVEGREPFPMGWLTRQKGVVKVPILTAQGTVIIRTAPFNKGEAWIHPGFAKYTFLARGIRLGRQKAATMLAKEAVIPLLAKNSPLG